MSTWDSELEQPFTAVGDSRVFEHEDEDEDEHEHEHEHECQGVTANR